MGSGPGEEALGARGRLGILKKTRGGPRVLQTAEQLHDLF